MSNKFKFFLPCNEANHVCDKKQYKEATLWEKIILTFHLVYCRACNKYTKNNTKLTRAVKDSKVICLDNKEKEVMKQEFENAIKEHSN